MDRHAVINLNGNFKDSGFGFSSFKQATSLNIKGEFLYITENQVEIRVSGSPEAIDAFNQWCLGFIHTIDGTMLAVNKHEKTFTKFIISNQI